MKNLLFISLLIIPFVGSSADIVFNRLDNLYSKNKSKCLEVSKRYMDWFPDHAGPHYFASLIYSDKAKKSRTPQGKYRNINKAIGYAIKFEEKENVEILSKVDWEGHRVMLKADAQEIVQRLRNVDEKTMVNKLLSSIDEFEGASNVVMIEESNSIYETVSRVERRNEILFDGQSEFFGMPEGIENVPSFDESMEQQLLELINTERKRKGLNELEWHEDLARACRFHAYDLATQNYFNHDTYDRQNGKLIRVGETFDRIKLFYNQSALTSENIAAGSDDANGTYHQWKNSRGHYENMMSKSSGKVGIGVIYSEDSPFGYYWVFCTAQ